MHAILLQWKIRSVVEGDQANQCRVKGRSSFCIHTKRGTVILSIYRYVKVGRHIPKYPLIVSANDYKSHPAFVAAATMYLGYGSYSSVATITDNTVVLEANAYSFSTIYLLLIGD